MILSSSDNNGVIIQTDLTKKLVVSQLSITFKRPPKDTKNSQEFNLEAIKTKVHKMNLERKKKKKNREIFSFNCECNVIIFFGNATFTNKLFVF